MDVKRQDSKTVMTEEKTEVRTERIGEESADGQGTADPEMSVEEAFERLEALLGELEKPDQPLEEAFASYEEGMKLVKFCSDALDRVEKKVLVLSGNGELDEF